MRNLLKAALFLSVASSFAIAQQGGRTIYLVRHAEKAEAPADDPALTPAGQKRAECLAQVLKDAGIKQIYVTDTKRTQQTAEPVAKALGLKANVLPAKDVPTLVRDLFYSTGNALVVGHSNTIPVIIQKLQGGTFQIKDNEFDHLFVLTITGEGSGTSAANLHVCAPSASSSPMLGNAQPKATPTPKKTATPKKKP
jgi:broad specificity phosphatase PhoE